MHDHNGTQYSSESYDKIPLILQQVVIAQAFYWAKKQ